MYEWNTLPWHQLEKKVFKLQKRIYQASERGEVKVVRRLQKLLISSWSSKAIAVRKVTQDNQGKKTAGVDGIKSLSPRKRLELVEKLHLGNKSKPTRRIWIPKPGKTEKADATPAPRELEFAASEAVEAAEPLGARERSPSTTFGYTHHE